MKLIENILNNLVRVKILIPNTKHTTHKNNSKRQSINGKEFDTYKVGTVAIWHVKMPNGDREEINRFFKEGEDDWIEIDEAEYQKRKEMEVITNGAD